MKALTTQFNAGDHLSVYRGVYWHHGIYIGDGMVIHFSGQPGQGMDLANAEIEKESLEFFSGNGNPKVVQYADETYDPEDVVCRAHMRLGERGYSVLSNNCEHFATWCKTGKHISEQVVNGKFLTKLLSLGLHRFGPLLSDVLIDFVDRTTYKDTCKCGHTVDGWTRVWLCRDCGTKYCEQCLPERPEVTHNTYRCVCTGTIDESQQIRLLQPLMV